ncbi:MAG: hypothetical protein WCY23_03900 [Candidatus Omnitrophota bacterium]
MNKKLLAIIMLFIVLLPAGCAHLGKKKAAAPDKDADRVYAWVSSLQLENGLLESSDGSNFVSLYENALAAVVFSAHGDLDRAERVLDYFDTRNGSAHCRTQKTAGYQEGMTSQARRY